MFVGYGTKVMSVECVAMYGDHVFDSKKMAVKRTESVGQVSPYTGYTANPYSSSSGSGVGGSYSGSGSGSANPYLRDPSRSGSGNPYLSDTDDQVRWLPSLWIYSEMNSLLSFHILSFIHGRFDFFHK
jgi:hypothetical protein